MVAGCKNADITAFPSLRFTKREGAEVARVDLGIVAELRKLEGWSIVGRELTKGFYLDTFSRAIDFINDIARIAKRLEHHPDILLSEFSTVRLFMKSNEFGRVTTADIEFAKEVERVWRSRWRRYEKKVW